MSSSTKRLTLPVLGPLTSSMGVQHNSAGNSSFQKLPTPGSGGGGSISVDPTARKMSAAAMLATSPSTPVLPTSLSTLTATAVASSSGSPSTSVLMCEELRKISDGKPMFKTSRKWFVLYDDNLKPLQGGRGSDASSTAAAAAEPVSSFSEAVVAHIPAHLEYHDSEKKWREGKAPNRDIVLQDCFNIYRKKDKEGLNGHIISLCTLKDSLDIVFENDRDLSIWMELLLCCQQGGRSSTGKLKRSIYENMWEVNVKGFKPVQAEDHRGSSSRSTFVPGSVGGAGSDAKDTFTNKTKFQMAGLHRMVVTHDTVKFFELGSNESKDFPIHYISGHSEGKSRYLKLGTGWHTIAGRGELELDVKDQIVSEAIIAAIFKPGHLRIDRGSSSSSHRSSKSSMNDPLASSTTKSIAANSYRPRSESWSNPTISHSLTNSGKSIIAGYPSSNHHQSKIGSHHSRQSGSRNRTSSEGTHFDIGAGKRGKASIMSSSPMSPGSCMSSESAGSSNSIDDHGDDGGGGGGLVHRGTPVEGGILGGVGGGPTPTAAATIFEESSGESWLDPVTVLEEEQRAARLAGNTSGTSTIVSSLPEPERGITYTEVDCYGSSVKCSRAAAGEPPDTAGAGTSPTGQLHYATIVDTSATSLQSNYAMMSSPPAPKVTSGGSSSSSSLKRQASASPAAPPSRTGTLERERRMLSMLGLTDSGHTGSTVTSPTIAPTAVAAAAETEGEEYTLMSPTSDGSLVVGYAPPLPPSFLPHHHHSRTASVPRQASEDYVDMSIPPPRKASVKHVSSSPSAALTSHLSGGPLLPLYTDVSCGQSSASAPPTAATGPVQTTTTLVSMTAAGAPPGDVDSPYLLMSPVSVPASTVTTTSAPEISSSSIIGRLMGEAAAAAAASAGTSVIAPEGTEDGIYIAMDFSAQSDMLNSLPPPAPAAAAPLPKPKRMSPSSSCSLVSGTPTSVTGSTGDFLHNRFASTTSECGAGGPEDEDLVSSRCTTAAKSKNIDIPCAKDATPSAGGGGSTGGESDKFTNTSPGGSMASRLGSWFRHRAGSVPARPVFSGRRRHRTQSEGDPEAIAAKATATTTTTPRD